jgi:hypothetical protein
VGARTAPYYQSVLDALQAHPRDELEAVRQLCVAVEAESLSTVFPLVQRLVREFIPNRPPLDLLPGDLFYETMARILAMDDSPPVRDKLREAFMSLLEWYAPVTPVRRDHDEQVTNNWERVFDFGPDPPPNCPEDELLRSYRGVRAMLDFVLLQYSQLNESRDGRVKDGPYRKPKLLVMEDGIVRLTAGWMAVHQQLLDRAIGWRRRINASKLLWLRELWLAFMENTFNLPNKARLGDLRIDIEEIRYGSGRKHDYVDAFRAHTLRRFGFVTYDRRPETDPPPQSMRLLNLLTLRDSQLRFLLDDYGVYYKSSEETYDRSVDSERDRVKAFADRKNVIDRVLKRGSPTDPDSESALARLLCNHFKVLVELQGKPQPDLEPAAARMLEFVQHHLDAWTIHSKYNLDETPSYFDRNLPRALSGAELFDCGVSAVRLAFLFSQIGECVSAVAGRKLANRISFVLLPLHVGLIVDMDPFVPFAMHNNKLFLLSQDKYDDWRDEWNGKKDRKGSDPTDANERRDKFLEDMAAQIFLRDVDLPLRGIRLVRGASPVTKKQVWSLYQAQVTPRMRAFFSPNVENALNKNFQFDIRFLAAMEAERTWLDDRVLPFWNEKCFKLWAEFRNDPLLRSDRDRTVRMRYADRLERLLIEVEGFYDPVKRLKDELNQALLANPGVLGSGTKRITASYRLTDSAAGIPPTGKVREHLLEIRNTHLFKGPPFASRSSFLTPIGE